MFLPAELLYNFLKNLYRSQILNEQNNYFSFATGTKQPLFIKLRCVSHELRFLFFTDTDQGGGKGFRPNVAASHHIAFADPLLQYHNRPDQ